jgi:hypothetical protein
MTSAARMANLLVRLTVLDASRGSDQADQCAITPVALSD